MKRIAISSCFLHPNRYNGETVHNTAVASFLDLLRKNNIAIIPFCPEQLGGLPTPRAPAEIQGKQVTTQDGNDVAPAFKQGAQATLELLKQQKISVALVKQKSPSCGFGKIYDGKFSGTLIAGNGITAELLHQNGITLYTEDDLQNPQSIIDVHFSSL